MYEKALLIIALLGALLGALLVAIVAFWPRKVEGFSYSSCRDKGFSKEFCVTTPTGAMGVGSCICDDGRVGMQLPGFYGECVCLYPHSPQVLMA